MKGSSDCVGASREHTRYQSSRLLGKLKCAPGNMRVKSADNGKYRSIRLRLEVGRQS
jgi:hypothetical protein